MPKLRDPFAVPARALAYRITQRIERLATREERPEIPLRIPGAVSLAATKAIGSNITITIIIIRLADPPATIFPLDTRWNRRHRSGGCDGLVVAYIGSPH